MRRPVAAPARPRARFQDIPAPVLGLSLTQSPTAADPRSAEVLENAIPTQRGARIRGGLVKSGKAGASIVSLFTFVDPALPKIFAATTSAIYDLSGLDPDTAPAASVSGLSAGYFSTQQIGTVGGSFLYAVNGADSARLFDGSSWSAITGVSSPIAITGVTTSTLSHVWLYRNRLFFVRKNTLDAYYLPPDSVGGAAANVSLAGIFQRGGSLLFGATWSLDSGQGLDDKCVFVSTEGEVAIYEGSDPSDPADWSLVGRYDVGRPLGIRGTMQAGGDLLIATVDGIVPLTQVIQKDPAALSLAAVTRPIETLWSFEAQRASSPVEVLKWTDRGLGLVTLPQSNSALAVNLQTGAWAVETAWTATSACVFLGQAYIAQGDAIFAIDEGGLDNGMPFTMRYCGAFQDFGDPMAYKRAQMMRCTFFAPQAFRFRASVATDYTATFPAAPAAADAVSAGGYMVWDVSSWDEDAWWSPAEEQASQAITGQWQSVYGEGYSMAPTIQITSGSTSKLNIELVRVDLAYEAGGAVV